MVVCAVAFVLANVTLSFAEDGPGGTRVANSGRMVAEVAGVTSDPAAGAAEDSASEASAITDMDSAATKADSAIAADGATSAGAASSAETDPKTNAEPSASTDLSDTEARQIEFIKKLKDELNMTKADYQQVLSEIQAAKINLKKISEERMSLQEQLQNLDNSIKISKKKLIDVIMQVVEKENQIKLILEQIDKKSVEIEYQKTLVADYIKMIYEKENAYLSIDENGEIDAFKFLLSDDTVGENLKKLKYLDLLNEAGQQMIDKLEFLNTELSGYKNELITKRKTLKYLERDLANEKKNLEDQKSSQIALLKMTNGQEKLYEQLLEQSTEQQQMVFTDLKTLSNAIVYIDKKIAEDGANFNIDNYSGLLDKSTKALYKFRLTNAGFAGFIWPVEPTNGISAFFRDPGYAAAFGVRHNAVDIPTYQGTPILAAADGVVYKTRDNGYGYSYIILAHSDGFMTVYGHVSGIMVTEGETISQGTIIGLSGGMPGTKGAGYMTTGPHLHFEVLTKGAYTDPLNYLPLSVFSRSQIEEAFPDKYWGEWESEATKDPLPNNKDPVLNR